MEGNELNVFAQTHCLENEKEDNLNDNISRHNKSGFRHFVEESTLRNVSLDELEELSDAGCPTNADGNIRRTPSSVSSEQPIRQAIILHCNKRFLHSIEPIIRVAFLVCCILSLSFISTCGTETTEVFDLPFSSSVRAHIFVTVFAILTNVAFFVIGVLSIFESFPLQWNLIDAAVHAAITVVLLISSAVLLNLEYAYFHNSKTPIEESTHMQLTLSGIFGVVGVLEGLFLTIIRLCVRRQPQITDEIILTALRSS